MQSPRLKKDITKLFEDIAADKTALLVQASDNELASALQASFKQVDVVENANDALDIHMPQRYDIIFIDLDLSDMTAKELIQNIKNYDYSQQFILLVSAENSAHLYDLININISYFITKPFSLNNFMEITLSVFETLLQKKLEEEKEMSEVYSVKFSQQQKLAQTGEMISMIAHQWRQPLSVITTIVATFRTKISLDFYKKQPDPNAALEKELLSSFTKIEESADFLSKTINDFRNFYKPNNETSTFNLAELVERICRMVMPDVELQNIQLDFDLDRSIFIKTFESELMQVIINLLNNARDAITEHQIKHPKILISIKSVNEYIYINVTDNAKGIPQHLLKNVFLPYFSTKTEKNGTGLGLHMSKNIIENHMKGELTVKNNTLFGGADFCITLNKQFVGVNK